jgi:DNA polymerase III subunit epsilon
LKARGYRWNPDGTPFPKAWFIDVVDDAREAELDFLRDEIYQRDIQLLARKIDAFNRFSDRL